MHVIIVGCGIGGLACALGLRKAGHEVTMLEKMPLAKEIGAGINVTPNATRALELLGVLPSVWQHGTVPEYAAMRSHDNFKKLSQQRLGSLMTDMYSTPYLMVHRYDLYAVLYEEAIRLGARVLLGQEVIVVDPQVPSVTTTAGQVFSGSLIVGADGEKSVCRTAVLGQPIPSKDSGDHVFRMVIPNDSVRNDPELSLLIDPPGINLLVGPGAHAMTYSLKRNDLLNVVLTVSHEGVEDPPVLPHRVDIAQVKQEFAGWTVVQKLLDISDECSRWTLLETDLSERWVTGKVVLLGDAAHAMLPFLGQGAAMALEDATVLSSLLSTISSGAEETSDLDSALQMYFRDRYPRVRSLKQKARALRDIYAHPVGPAQQSRDAELAADMELIELGKVDQAGNFVSVHKASKFAEGSPNFLMDAAFRDSLFGYNQKRREKAG